MFINNCKQSTSSLSLLAGMIVGTYNIINNMSRECSEETVQMCNLRNLLLIFTFYYKYLVYRIYLKFKKQNRFVFYYIIA